jgi:ribonuclease P protein component
LFLLAKKFRLPSFLISQLLKQGQRDYSDHFILIYNKQKTSQQTRTINHSPCFAFIISRKVNKKAVVRNKLKRQLSHVVQKNLDQFKKNYNFLLLARKAELINHFSQISAEVLTLFKKAQVLEEK